MTVTFRADVVDPSGTTLQNYNYTWFMNVNGQRVVLANRISFNYTFREE
ncbi:MAG: hypothetical protein LBF15_00415 [Candidatus Peribacteria bacterium]|nr:hypothetical protein [Candidatus Peribacteria bacterium]